MKYLFVCLLLAGCASGDRYQAWIDYMHCTGREAGFMCSQV